MPPFTCKVWPVMYFDWLDAKNTTASAMSWASPNLPKAMLPAKSGALLFWQGAGHVGVNEAWGNTIHCDATAAHFTRGVW